MRKLIRELFFKMGFDNVEATANDKAIYVEHKGKFYKLEVTVSTHEEFHKSWDYAVAEGEGSL